MDDLISKQKSEPISFHSKESRLDKSDIYIVKQMDNHITIHSRTNKISVDSVSLKMFEREYKDFGFIMANNNTLVNTEYIECFYLGNNRSLILSNGIQIKISRRKLHLFKSIILEKGIS
jgi:DNA-binding LytR/AlgR family response regulator